MWWLGLLTLILTLVTLRSASTAGDAATDTDIQRQLDEMKSEMNQLNSELTSLREYNVIVHKDLKVLVEENDRLKGLISTGVTPRDVGRPPTNCTLGSNFRFDEIPDMYGAGLTYPINAGFNAYQCLDLCRLDPDCVAVSIGQDPKDCEGYTEMPTTLQPTSFWNFYPMVYNNACLVDRPVVEFMASVTHSPCPGTNELVVWDWLLFDSGHAMKSDGRFHCPVSGTYKFTLSVLTYEGGSNGLAIRLNDVTWLAFLYFDSLDGDKVPGTIDVYSYCKAGESVSVWGNYPDSCFVGDASYVYSSFSGRLV